MNGFKKNILFAMVAQGSSTLLSILISMVLPKVLGVTPFAYWQLFIFYSGYVGVFHFGLSDGLYLRYGGTNFERMDKALIGSQFRLMIIWLSIISVVSLCIIPFVISDEYRLFVWFMTAIYLVVANVTWGLGYIFQAANRTDIYSIGMLISKLTFMIFLFVFILLHVIDFRMYVGLYVFTQAIAMFFLLVKGWAVVNSKWIPIKCAIGECFTNIKIGIHLTFSNIASTFILGIGKAFVDNHWNITAFGVFSLSISLVNFVLQFISQVGMVLFPALRQVDEDRRVEVFKLLRDSLGLVLCGVIILYVPLRAILIVWLPDYSESIRYLSIILPIVVFDGKMQLIYNTYMKVMRKEKTLLAINLSSCAVSIALCWLFTRIQDDVIVVVLAMIIAVAYRCMIAEITVSRMIHIKVSNCILVEIALVTVFSVLNYYVVTYIAFIGYLCVYLIVILFMHQRIRNVFKLMR